MLVATGWVAAAGSPTLNLQYQVAVSSCKSPFHLLIPHVCSSDGESSEGATASPPPKRPEAFPPPTTIASEETVQPGKGKRKARDTGADASADLATGAQDSGLSEAQPSEVVERFEGTSAADDDVSAQSGSAPKKPREEKGRDSRKGTRVPVPMSGVKLRPLSSSSTKFPFSSWNEHRDAVGSRANVSADMER